MIEITDGIKDLLREIRQEGIVIDVQVLTHNNEKCYHVKLDYDNSYRELVYSYNSLLFFLDGMLTGLKLHLNPLFEQQKTWAAINNNPLFPGWLLLFNDYQDQRWVECDENTHFQIDDKLKDSAGLLWEFTQQGWQEITEEEMHPT